MKVLLLNYLISATWLTLMMYVISCDAYKQTHPKINFDTATSTSGNTVSTSDPPPDSNNGSVISQHQNNSLPATSGRKSGGLTSFAVASSTGSFTRLVSPNGAYNLVMQSDGNLVENNYITKVWSSGTGGVGKGPYQAVLQSNGMLAVLEAAGATIWSSGTGGKGTPPYELTVQNDGNVVLFDATNSALWSTNQTDSSQDLSALPFESSVSSTGNFTKLTSPNGVYTLTMQASGNLVLTQGNTTLWSSGTSGIGKAPYQAAMLATGDLAVTDAAGTVTFKSGSAGQGKPPYTLIFNNYGNVKIYDMNQVLVWSMMGSTGTVLLGASWSPPAPSLITNQPADRCLSTAKNGVQTILWDCANADVNQVMLYSFDQELQIGADRSRCLTYETPANAQAYVDTQPCTGATLQRWSISAIDGSFGVIHPLVDSSQCLDVAGAGTANSSAVIVATCAGSASQNWSKKATGYSIYNANLPYWPDPSYTDSTTIAQQEAAWGPVSAALVAAAQSGASSYTIPPGIYRAASQTNVNNIKNNFTIYAAGVELISENGALIFNFSNDTNITLNGPIVFDADTYGWLQATVVATDGATWMNFQLQPGYPALESLIPTQFRLHLRDSLGGRKPTGMWPMNNVGESAAPNAAPAVMLGGGIYQLNNIFNGYFPPLANEIRVGDILEIQYAFANLIGADTDTTINFNHGRLYGGACCQFYGAINNTFRDWKHMGRPGTKRIGGSVVAYHPGIYFYENTSWTFDEADVVDAVDDLTDIGSAYQNADHTPQQGLAANQFYQDDWQQQPGWTISFRDPTTGLSYATAKVTNVASSGTQAPSGNWATVITLDHDVTVLPDSGIDTLELKMALGVTVDSYFADGDAEGIQFKGAHLINITNNYVSRAGCVGARISIGVNRDWGEGGFNDYATVNNNTINQNYFSSLDTGGAAISEYASNNLGQNMPQAFIKTTYENNKIINSTGRGLVYGAAQQTTAVNNPFTFDPQGLYLGWLP